MKLAAPVESPPSIGVAPLLDIVFLLLVFFMVTTSFRSAEIPLELADAASAEQSTAPREVLVVEISAAGAIHLDGEPLEPDALGRAFARAAGAGGKPVVLRADEGTPHGRVVTVLDLARRRGLTDVAIAVDAARPSAPAPVDAARSSVDAPASTAGPGTAPRPPAPPRP